MAIGIGLHCWYCEHGPCNNMCQEPKKEKSVIRDKKIDKILKKEKIGIKKLINTDYGNNN